MSESAAPRLSRCAGVHCSSHAETRCASVQIGAPRSKFCEYQGRFRGPSLDARTRKLCAAGLTTCSHVDYTWTAAAVSPQRRGAARA